LFVATVVMGTILIVIIAGYVEIAALGWKGGQTGFNELGRKKSKGK
jgi:hypothetical protein